MTDTSGSPTAALPRQGDVLITASRQSGYTVSVVPGPGQVLFKTYNEALVAGQEFARSRLGTSLWSTEDGTQFTLLSLDQPLSLQRDA
jgi:hypothetical protein